MLKAKYWITSGLLLIVLNFMAFVAYYISQALMQIFDPFKEWILYYLFSLILTLFVNFAILCYFHLWLRERKIKINLDWQSVKSALLTTLILFIYYNTIILINFYSKYFINVDIMAIYHRLTPIIIIYFLVFFSFFYFLFDNFKLIRK
ncbi:hypothetical protein [Microcystis sp. M061S2]|uniref:hypothetical protein n=1 Tax=Microcystis sp. M061S2 TaxID=2771171 RepID=UPI0025830258|nr:hypothetical protein [Microcystis sp. M061S2]MCA2652904.1 hypothetical protein [Microcystis sp. M061S2]